MAVTVEIFNYPVSTTGVIKRHMKWEGTMNGEQMTVCKERDVREYCSLQDYPITMGL